ncbi:MAG: hypothetical protein COW84_10400 [Gammaproteobacteria bacterium CG22_combo_CG10-13_8_21_14_all_40_8]|nr:MAG: hypothetical protein COW84_10400 [Gammaproteobacteria bacterium CG22_combo_CG10-13_8_21_14_all_40_8]
MFGFDKKLPSQSIQHFDKHIEIAKKDPFNRLPENFSILIGEQVSLHRVKAKTWIIQSQEQDDYDYYLVQGTVKDIASDGKFFYFDETDKKALSPLSWLRPRQYSTCAESKWVTYLQIPHHVVETAKSALSHYQKAGEIEVDQIQQDPELNFIIEKIRLDIDRDRMNLPSIPKVALKIREAAQQKDIGLADIARICLRDPVICAKLIKAANSAYYRGVNMISDAVGAVTRLGKDVTQQLVLYYAIKEQFNAKNTELNNSLSQICRESMEVAILAKVIAKLSKIDFDLNTAFMAGLLHRIGEVPIYAYADDFIQNQQELELIPELARRMGAEIGERIIRQWNLGDEYAHAIAKGANLRDDTQAEASYADVVIAAKAHYLIRHKLFKQLPVMAEISALKKIRLGEISPQLSIEILLTAEKEIRSLDEIFPSSQEAISFH